MAGINRLEGNFLGKQGIWNQTGTVMIVKQNYLQFVFTNVAKTSLHIKMISTKRHCVQQNI